MYVQMYIHTSYIPQILFYFPSLHLKNCHLIKHRDGWWNAVLRPYGGEVLEIVGLGQGD
jgi:hypothetical protein